MIKRIFFIFILFFAISFSFADAQQKKEKTEITGNKMIIKNSGKIAVFKGNAKIVRGNSTITADNMTYFKDTFEIDADGKVKFAVKNEDGSVIKAFSEKAVYNTKNSGGKMWGGSPVIEYNLKNSTDTVLLYMDNLYLNDGFESAKAVDNVKIISSSGTIISDNALLTKKDNTLYMHKDKNKPQVNVWQDGKTAEFKADKISLLYNDKIVKMNKNVEGKIIFDTLEVKQ